MNKHVYNFVVVNGKEYYVSTNLTFDRGWETMVFHSENQKVTDWMEVFALYHESEEEAYKTHEEVVEKLHLYLLCNF